MDTKQINVLKFLSIINLLCACSNLIAFAFSVSICKILPFTKVIAHILGVISVYYYLHKLGIILIAAIIFYAALTAIFFYKNKALNREKILGILKILICNVVFPLVGYVWLLFLGSLI